MGQSPENTAAVHADRFDASTFAESRLLSGDLDHMVVEAGKEHDYAEDFFADFFHLLHKGDPTLRERSEMAPTHTPNHTMVAAFATYKEVTSLRAMSANDSYAATMALISMGSEIAEAYAAMEAARAAAAAVVAALEAASEQGAGESEASALIEAVGAALAAELAATGECGAAIRAAATKAEAGAIAEAELFAGYGVDPGQARRMDFATRANLARRLGGTKLAAFAHLVGAFRAFARGERRRRVVGVPEQIVGVALGADVLAATTEEVIAMATPELAEDFLVRAATSRLLVNTYAGVATCARGPLVVCVDESSSMNVDHGGVPREAWSKAVALALAEVARIGGRDLVYLGFSSATEQRLITFERGATPIEAILDMVEHQFNGGTAYEPALDRALDIVEGYPADQRPDIVFITDGEHPGLASHVVERVEAVKKATSMRIFAVTIGFDGANSAAITAFADDVREVADLADPASLSDIYASL